MTRDTLIQQALKITRNRYLLVHLLTQRIRQLREGSQPLVTVGEETSLEEASLEEIALEEIAEQKLKYELSSKTSDSSGS